MQEYVSGAGKYPEDDRLPTSVRQSASETEGYGLSVFRSFALDLFGMGPLSRELLYGNRSSTSDAWKALKFSIWSNAAPESDKMHLSPPELVHSVSKMGSKGRNVPAWYPLVSQDAPESQIQHGAQDGRLVCTQALEMVSLYTSSTVVVVVPSRLTVVRRVTRRCT